jgi:serine/threonine protein kinase
VQPGSHLGPYEIVAPIGAGGMGEVYKAHDTRLGRRPSLSGTRRGRLLAGTRSRGS